MLESKLAHLGSKEKTGRTLIPKIAEEPRVVLSGYIIVSYVFEGFPKSPLAPPPLMASTCLPPLFSAHIPALCLTKYSPVNWTK